MVQHSQQTLHSVPSQSVQVGLSFRDDLGAKESSPRHQQMYLKWSLLCTQDFLRSHQIIKLTQSRKESLEEMGKKGMFLSFHMLLDWKFRVYRWLCSYRSSIAHSNWAAWGFLYLKDWFLASLKEILKRPSTEKCWQPLLYPSALWY